MVGVAHGCDVRANAASPSEELRVKGEELRVKSEEFEAVATALQRMRQRDAKFLQIESCIANYIKAWRRARR